MASERLAAGSTETDDVRAQRKPWETPVLREILVEGVTEGKTAFPAEGSVTSLGRHVPFGPS